VPGEYLIRFEASDPAHTVADQLRVLVYPANQAPVIEAATFTAEGPLRPGASGLLAATTSDPDGDVISHWWSVKSAPAGTTPILESPGAPNTRVTGLTVAGGYVFTLTVVDRTKAASRDVGVTVAG
jgi:hypothetical protein